MGSYQRVLLEYAKPGNYYHNRNMNQDERRLRWWKMEAYGNSTHKSTEFNLRRSHIMNRKLQLNLEKDVLFFTKVHGIRCTDIERKQKKLWGDQQHRETSIGKSYLDDVDSNSNRGRRSITSSGPVTIKRNNTVMKISPDKCDMSLLNNHTYHISPGNNSSSLPYSEPSDFTIQRHYYDPSIPVSRHIARSAIQRVESLSCFGSRRR